MSVEVTFRWRERTSVVSSDLRQYRCKMPVVPRAGEYVRVEDHPSYEVTTVYYEVVGGETRCTVWLRWVP